MILRQASFYVALLATSAACHATDSAQQDVPVLSAIAQAECSRATGQPDGKYQVIPDQTDTIVVTSFPETLDRDAIKSLRARNTSPHRLPNISLCPSVRLASDRSLNSAMKRKTVDGTRAGWDGFYRTFPGSSGILSLSLPGYSANGNLAIVQVAYACGPLCGAGFYWVLEYVEGRWVIKERSSAWIS
jgi:hypothetical protein